MRLAFSMLLATVTSLDLALCKLTGSRNAANTYFGPRSRLLKHVATQGPHT